MNGSRRKVLVASVMEIIQVIMLFEEKSERAYRPSEHPSVKARGKSKSCCESKSSSDVYICIISDRRTKRFGSKISSFTFIYLQRVT